MKQESSGKETTYTYDGRGQLIQEAVTESASHFPIKTPSLLGVRVTARTVNYAYDYAGNRIYKFDKSNKSEVVTHYEYDRNNRLLQETRKSGKLGELTNASIYGYDCNGNQVSRRSIGGELPSRKTASFFGFPLKTPKGVLAGLLGAEAKPSDSVETKEYNVFNRLTAVRSETIDAAYAYQPDGLRLSKTVNGELTTHVWDGANIVAELGERRALKDRYISGIGLVRNGMGENYVFDAHGSVVRLVDGEGEVRQRYDYDAFGIELNPNADDINPWRYTGEYFDNETGIIYLKERNYNPITGRFTQEDPFFRVNSDPSLNIYSVMQAVNLYVYAVNNPIRFTDPTGLFIEEHPGRGVFTNPIANAVRTAVNAATKNASSSNGSASPPSLSYAERNAGITLIWINEAWHRDISVPLNRALDITVGQAEARSQFNSSFAGFPGNLWWFYRQMNHGSSWDIKREDVWNQTIAQDTFPGRYTRVHFMGMLLTPEELGNFTYGYIGSALGLAFDVLKEGSIYAAGFPAEGTPRFYDEIRDHIFINIGHDFHRLGARERWNSRR